MIDVYTFCLFMCDDTASIRIYDMNEDVGSEVFIGSARGAMYSKWEGYEVESIDLCRGNINDDFEPFIVLNIDTTSTY